MLEYIVGGFKLSSTKLVSYPIDVNRRPRTADQENTVKNLSRGDYNGFMSPKTKSKVCDMINNWYTAIHIAKKRSRKEKSTIRPYLSFITVTLPSVQIHTDNEIKRECLNSFIVKLKEQKGIENYFWRAEAQANGNIHFHLIVDRYINMNWLQKNWNIAINNLGYVDRYCKMWGHRQPPSTHIKKVSTIQEAAKYVTAYLKKHENRRIIKGRIWGCSDQLREIKSLNAIHEEDFYKFEEYLKKSAYVHQKHDTNYSFYCGDMFLFLSKEFKGLYKDLEIHYQLEFNKLYPEKEKIFSSKVDVRKEPVLNVTLCPF